MNPCLAVTPVAGMTKKPVKSTRVAVVGGGLVGSMCASVLAKRGYSVNVYEFRGDIREAETVRGRSINMALSVRGRTALKEIGLENYIIKELGTPMRGRMIHRVDGTKYSIPYDEINNECIYSVSRKQLNETLLTAAEKYPNVKMHFNTKMISADLENGVMTFLGTEAEKVFKAEADLIIGADGAYSSVRKEIMKHPLYNFSQQYIEHGYMELFIPSNSKGEFAMEPGYLHIWPRGNFMMIALPNQDKTWTSTLFMPFAQYEELTDGSKLITFFERYFPDALLLMTKERLCKDFFSVKPFPLISIKCKPYHFQDKALIIGDAAHAMVPFYGQGMNAGFEDCTVLNSLMIKYGDRLNLVLPEFSKIRNPDAEAICDLSMYNYVEMRDLVNRKSFLIRKKVDNLLYRLFPKMWVPLYNSVTFTNMKYSQCTANEKYQERILVAAIVIILAEIFLFLCSIWTGLST